jgi:hypothetical protein
MYGFSPPATPNSLPAEGKALLVTFVALALKKIDEASATVPAEKGPLIDQLRQMAELLPGLWAAGELPEPIAEMMRRFGPDAS